MCKIGWKKVKIKEIATEIKENFNPINNPRNPYIGLEHIEQQTLRIKKIGRSDDSKSLKRKFYSGNILFGRMRPYFRKVVRPKFNGVCSGEIIVIKHKKNTHKVFLFYLLASEKFVDRVTQTSGGADRPRAKWSVIKNLNILIPNNYGIQQKIASILSNYDDLIENNTKRIELLENIAQLIYKEWFVHFRDPGYKTQKLIDSGLGKIPEGWEVKKLKDYVDFIKGVEPGSKNYQEKNESGLIPFLRVGDLTGSRISNIFINRELTKNRILENNDIAVTFDGTVGIVKRGLYGSYSSGIRKLVLKNKKIKKSFLYFLMMSDLIQKKIKEHAKGTTILHAGESINYMEFILPYENLLNKFDEIINPLLKNLLYLQQKNDILIKTRDLLLPKLISGEIDVEMILE